MAFWQLLLLAFAGLLALKLFLALAAFGVWRSRLSRPGGPTPSAEGAAPDEA